MKKPPRDFSLICFYLLFVIINLFSDLMLFVGRQEEQLTHKKSCATYIPEQLE